MPGITAQERSPTRARGRLRARDRARPGRSPRRSPPAADGDAAREAHGRRGGALRRTRRALRCSSEFHSPHSGHWPCHLRVSPPQELQTKTGFRRAIRCAVGRLSARIRAGDGPKGVFCDQSHSDPLPAMLAYAGSSRGRESDAYHIRWATGGSGRSMSLRNKLRFVGLTDTGKVREHNEDTIAVDRGHRPAGAGRRHGRLQRR